MSRPKGDDLARVLSHLVVADCWEWDGYIQQNGYAKTSAGSELTGDARTVLVHRFVYSTLTGRDLSGLDIDHLCKNRKCAKPDHLEPVTRVVNIRRGATGVYFRKSGFNYASRAGAK